jgi:hypothetical protein
MLAAGSVGAAGDGWIGSGEHVVYDWTFGCCAIGEREWWGKRLSGSFELYCGADTGMEVSSVVWIDAGERAVCVCRAITQSVQEGVRMILRNFASKL